MENELLIKINGTAKDFDAELDKVIKKTEDLEKAFSGMTKKAGVSFLALSAALAVNIKTYADYETALIGVGKTTDIQGKKLENFGKKFQDLSAKIPMSTNELLGIAQAAGQLGVRGEENLLRFTDTVAKLGYATDLTGEEAALALTRILTVTGEGVETIDKFGSVIVALGNNFAATESEIVRVATEVSRSTSVFGVSAAQAAALGASLRTVGIQAETGGSAVGRAFRAIDASIRGGGASLENLMVLTGMTEAQLKKTFEENSVEVFQRFVEGLGRVADSGGSVAAALGTFRLKGDEILKVLPVLAQRSELLGSALAMANAEMQNATALNEEAQRAFDSLASEFTKASNAVTKLSTGIGKELAEDVKELLQGITSLTNSINDMDGATVSAIAQFLKWGIAVAASVLAVGTAGIAYLKLTQIISALAIAFRAGRMAIALFTAAATGGLSLVIGFLPEIISGIAAMTGALNKNEKPKTLENVTQELKNINREIDKIEEKKLGARTTRDIFNLKSLKEQRTELENLQKSLFNTSKDFGDGSLLMQVSPTTDLTKFNPLDSLQKQEIPFAPNSDEVNQIKKNEQLKLDAAKKGSEQRVNALKLENETLLESNRLFQEKAAKEEVEFSKRRIELKHSERNAQEIEDANVKALTLENIRLKNQELLNEEKVYYEKKREQDKIEQEQQIILDDILRTMKLDKIHLQNEEDLKILKEKINTQAQLEKKSQNDEIIRQIQSNNTKLENTKKYGAGYSALYSVVYNEEVQAFKTASSQLVVLQNSKNQTMKSIGKAAASTNAAIATAEGAIKAYASLSGIPLIGPALGAAAAAALVAYGAEQQSQILAANKGGVVPFSSGAKAGVDSVPAMLTPNELVVPAQNFDEVVSSVAESRGYSENGNTSSNSNTLIVQGNIFNSEETANHIAEILLDGKKHRNLKY